MEVRKKAKKMRKSKRRLQRSSIITDKKMRSKKKSRMKLSSQ